MIRREAWQIDGADGQPIYGDTHLPAHPDAKAVLVLCHGFKGYKDYGFFPQLAQRAADAGVIAHRFNFSHSGMTNNIATFERPELFERDTWNKQIEDLTRVIHLRGEPPRLPIIVFGHSRGGVIAILTAAPGVLPIAGVICAAAPATPWRLDREQRNILHKTGKLAAPSGRTGQTLYIGVDWLREIEANPDAFDPIKAIARVRCPVLVIHGDKDETVDVADAHRLAVAGNKERRIIPGANHVFNAPNPLAVEDRPPPQTERLYDEVLGFIVRVSGS